MSLGLRLLFELQYIIEIKYLQNFLCVLRGVFFIMLWCSEKWQLFLKGYSISFVCLVDSFSSRFLELFLSYFYHCFLGFNIGFIHGISSAKAYLHRHLQRNFQVFSSIKLVALFKNCF